MIWNITSNHVPLQQESIPEDLQAAKFSEIEGKTIFWDKCGHSAV